MSGSTSSWPKMVAMTVVVVLIVVAGQMGSARAAMSPSQCNEERRVLVNACRAVILGISTSPSCCKVIRETHVECICPLVTPKLAALINVQRTLKQIEGCGRTLPRHFKCIATP